MAKIPLVFISFFLVLVSIGLISSFQKSEWTAFALLLVTGLGLIFGQLIFYWEIKKNQKNE
ncbi:hypothetical protein SAMN06265367_10915 [Algoriphagus winogradskyi]|uniref:Uncharacterized protein n=1 Tax=Algoriphagus winogradskyi TaxID=237017 RepID=A0ABY1PGG6_9BACT|nr:hypothetical protein SAMN06265367_10915 [Algoriphagus winogradskyi]